MKSILSTLAVAAGISLAGLSSAVAGEPVAQQNSNAFWFESWTGLSNATLKVAHPSGLVESVYAESGTPVYQLPAGAADGVYSYEMTAATDQVEAIVDPSVNNGRGEAAATQAAVGYATGGSFVVSRGAIVAPDDAGITEE
ncbi:MAG: hypothetical protein ABJO27_27510 [Pseudoruegeria sp.]